jgi:hypothetical protein
MYRHSDESEKYLRQYPDLNRWLNVCITCGMRGYKPELPDNIYPGPNVAADHLRQFFPPLPVDELGRCAQCGAASG